jgi:predicted RNase H-like nuclease (RuvC/YqgF family)
LAALPLLALFTCLAQAQSTGDPVADAARKAREQKKEAPKPKRVYTNDDVANIRSAPINVLGTPPPSTPETPAENKPKDAEAKPDAKAADGQQAAKPAASGPQESEEAKWRRRFKEVRDKLARAEKELEILQREDNKAQVQYYSDPQKAMTEQYSRKDINEKNAKIAAKQQEIQALKQRLSDLEDDLRKSGGDPGWAQ